LAAELGTVQLIIIVFNSGCASMAKYDMGYRYPYGATTTDLAMIALSTRCYSPEDANPFDFLYSPLFIPLYIIDLPFSIITDTITLP
jgi:uncharacterized protein YceK